MKQSITLERNIVHKSVTHSTAREAPSTELFSVMKSALSISCKEPCDWRMTYTTDLSPAHCSVKLEHHPRGNTRVEPLTSENMTADSREEKCLKRTNTAQSQSSEKQLSDPQCCGSPRREGYINSLGRKPNTGNSEHSIPTGIFLDWKKLPKGNKSQGELCDVQGKCRLPLMDS